MAWALGTLDKSRVLAPEGEDKSLAAATQVAVATGNDIQEGLGMVETGLVQWKKVVAQCIELVEGGFLWMIGLTTGDFTVPLSRTMS